MGSSSKTTNQIPAYITQGGMEAIERARKIADMGYVPYMGPDVAMPGQGTLAAWQNQNQAANAFGMAAPTSTGLEGLPVSTQGGITGYNSFPGYAAALESLAAEYPGLYAYLSSMTIDPVTGAPGANMGGGGTADPWAGIFGVPSGMLTPRGIREGSGFRGEDTSPTGGGGFDRVNDVLDRADRNIERAVGGLLGR